MQRKIGINVVSLAPYSLGRNGVARTKRIVRSARFDGIQLLPLRGWQPTDTRLTAKSVISLEEAWHSGSADQVVRRLRHRGLPDDPTLLDFLLFGSDAHARYDAFRHRFSCAVTSSHVLDHRPIEMHPELELSEDEYVHHPGGVIWDTRHVVRAGVRGSKRPVTLNWMVFLERFKPEQIKLVHVNIPHDQVYLFCKGALLQTRFMLQALSAHTACPIILEVEPTRIPNKLFVIARLFLLRRALSEYF